MTFYWREARKGNLQLLCHLCNSRKGALPNPVYREVLADSGLLPDGRPDQIESATEWEELWMLGGGRP